MNALKAVAPGLVIGLLATSGPGCLRRIDPGPETLSSFEVKIDFDAMPTAGNPYGQCTWQNGDLDLCPGGPGTVQDPIAFNGEQWAQVRIDIQAVGSRGTKPFTVDGPVQISTRAGSIFGQTRQVNLIGGEANDVVVRFRRTPGPTYIWVEDVLPRFDADAGPPSHAAGVSDVALYFDQPTIVDIQRTDDECCSPLDGQRVDITRGELYITRLTGNGFNLQDVSAPEWNGLFVFAFNGIQGLRVGTKLLGIAGAITEFQSGTQLTEPIYTPLNGLCGQPTGATEGGQETEENEASGGARPRCPRGSTCLRDDEGAERCTPPVAADSSVDDYGRKICAGPTDGSCPPGLSCQTIAGQGQFCQVEPLPLPLTAFPTAPYCGPINTQSDLSIEALEGALVKIVGGPDGIRPGGLPVCKRPDGDDPLHQVRSTCFKTLDDGRPVHAPDCTLAEAGDRILRDDEGNVCFRGNQACKWSPGLVAEDVRSTCNEDPAKRRCEDALPGDPVLTNCVPDDNAEVDPCDLDLNPDLQICRGTLDDFITSGYETFGQAKVLLEDAGGQTLCATVNLDALPSFDIMEEYEKGTRWKSITGTLRQIRFRSATSFWMLDVRFPEDLVPLDP